jgi:hypothetical protein
LRAPPGISVLEEAIQDGRSTKTVQKVEKISEAELLSLVVLANEVSPAGMEPLAHAAERCDIDI